MILLDFDENGKAQTTIKPDPSFAEIFAGVEKAPDTDDAQLRHKELREKGDLTEEEENELNDLFFTIYPQLW